MFSWGGRYVGDILGGVVGEELGGYTMIHCVHV